MENKPIVNSSHGPGVTCLTFSRDGKEIYTGGVDCIVRIWKSDEGEGQEPDVAMEAMEGITSISAATDYWVSGSVDSDVRSYEKGKNVLIATLTSGVGNQVRCVAVDPKGKRVAIATDERRATLVDVDDSNKTVSLDGHTSSVRRLSWHPSGTLLTLCCADGKIAVWDVSEDQPKMVHTIEGVLPVVENSESPEYAHDCSALWHSSGQFFYVITRTQEIAAIAKDTWTKSYSFTDSTVSGTITSFALSSNGVYLASSSNMEVYIWSTQTRRLLSRTPGTSQSAILQLAFSPVQNLLAWTDADGVLTRLPNPIPPNLPDPVKATAAGSSKTTFHKRGATPTLLFGEDEGGAPALDEEDNMDIDDNWIIDDTDGAMRDEPEGKKGYVKEMVSITKAQPPFQPGATPMENKKQYLAYNMTGVIDVTDQDTHHIVNVEFHDKSLRKGYHFTDTHRMNLGYLGERGALFAGQPHEDHPARVVYKPYGTFAGSQSEWTYLLKRPGTTVLGVAAGGVIGGSSSKSSLENDLLGLGNVVVATSECDLTFLSGTGRERRIMGLGAEYVTMAAAAEWVFVIHRAGGTTIDGSQNLSYSLINFDDFSVRQHGVLPVAKGQLLKWVGLTDEGAPVIYDTSGWLHILTKFRVPMGASWARLMDTNLLERRQGKDESYWPVGVSGDLFMCLILKGRQKYPSFPKPLIQELLIRLPFRKDADENAPEEQIERETLLLDLMRDALDPDELTTTDIANRELQIDREFIKLIQLACKSENPGRALELAKLLHFTQFVEKAAQIAEFYHLVGLREKLEKLGAERQEGEDRLEAARRRRKEWAKPDRPPRQLPENGPASWAPSKPFQDSMPLPTVHRPGLARATPIIEQTRYTGSTNGVGSSLAGLSLDPAPARVSPPVEGKRKRSEDDIMGEMTTAPLTLPKNKANPFARKADAETKNPFARRLENTKSIQKSESFFEKVDAAENRSTDVKTKKGRTKDKVKVKEGGPRQTTLFGMIPNVAKKPKTSDLANTDFVMQDQDTQLLEESQHTMETQESTDSQQSNVTQTTDEEGVKFVEAGPSSPTVIDWPDSPREDSKEGI